MAEAAPQLRVAGFDELDTTTLYALLRLRIEVFVVEQQCPYPELDGRDSEPATRHLWLPDESGQPLAYLRILSEAGNELRIGRVSTARHARGRGLAGRLLRAALAWTGERPVRLAAQSHSTGFYARYGFVIDGAEFVEDGIPHQPMVRRP